MTTEFVLLLNPDARDRGHHILAIPEGATRHDVPNRDGIDPHIRGRTFERTGLLDMSGFPLFRVCSRQL